MIHFKLKLLRKPAMLIAAICCFSFIFVIAIRNNGYLESLELTAYDWLIRVSHWGKLKEQRITIIGITENDILQLGEWPLTDAVAAEALAIIINHKPKAIGLDIYRDIPVSPGHDKLNEILIENNNIYTVMKFGHGGVPPPPVLANSNQVGFNDIIVDAGGVVRRGLLFLDDGQTAYSAFSLLLAQHYLQDLGVFLQPAETNPDYLKLGSVIIPPLEKNDGGYINVDSRGYQYLLDYSSDLSAIATYPLSDLLAGNIPPQAITGKLVLIGVTAESVKDLFYTPKSRGTGNKQQTVAGISMHAHATSQMLRFGIGESVPLKSVSEKQELGWIFTWTLIGCLLGAKIRSPWYFSLLGAFGLLLLWLTVHSAFMQSYWVTSVPAGLSFILSASLATSYMSYHEKKKRTLLMQLFSQHVAPEIAESIWRNRDQFFSGSRLKSQKMPATVFFSDLKGYTSAAEKLDPQTLIDWLNDYMESMTNLVMAYGGVVDDYAGDGIKANFGVPFPRETEQEIAQDAQQAVSCALEMGKNMERLNHEWQNRGLPVASMRIGIYSGQVIAGVLGSSQRLKYTSVGDTVNTAARLESYEKKFATNCCWRILIGESTRNLLEDRFNLQLVGEEALKGKGRKTKIYRVLEI